MQGNMRDLCSEEQSVELGACSAEVGLGLTEERVAQTGFEVWKLRIYPGLRPNQFLHHCPSPEALKHFMSATFRTRMQSRHSSPESRRTLVRIITYH